MNHLPLLAVILAVGLVAAVAGCTRQGGGGTPPDTGEPPAGEDLGGLEDQDLQDLIDGGLDDGPDQEGLDEPNLNF
ncbi:MAG: hypothetical protein HY520_01945 [Candidatus Aenigmarchaeota archaeon]|nr:hypothetical protein [Candidatus Aenigmarchaeota archaeon]